MRTEDKTYMDMFVSKTDAAESIALVKKRSSPQVSHVFIFQPTSAQRLKFLELLASINHLTPTLLSSWPPDQPPPIAKLKMIDKRYSYILLSWAYIKGWSTLYYQLSTYYNLKPPFISPRWKYNYYDHRLFSRATCPVPIYTSWNDLLKRSPVQDFSHDTWIAFDVEYCVDKSKPTASTYASLLQVSNSKCVWVFDMLHQAAVNAAHTVLKDATIKVAYNSFGDVSVLATSTTISPLLNTLDVGVLAQYTYGFDNVPGLSSMVGYLFSLHLHKDYQTADWSVRPLPPSLLLYAASDAYWTAQTSSRIVLKAGYSVLDYILHTPHCKQKKKK